MKLNKTERATIEKVREVLEYCPDDPMKDYMDDAEILEALGVLMGIIDRSIQENKSPVITKSSAMNRDMP